MKKQYESPKMQVIVFDKPVFTDYPEGGPDTPIQGVEMSFRTGASDQFPTDLD